MGRKIEKEEFLRFVPKLTKSQIEDYGISASKYDCVYDFRNYFAIVELNGKYGLINEVGQEIIEPKYDWVYKYEDYYSNILEFNGVILELNGRYGVVNEKSQIVKLKYDYVGDFDGDFATVRSNNKWGLINKEGKEIVEPKYNYVHRFGENFKANLKGKIYYFDKEGKEINQPKC